MRILWFENVYFLIFSIETLHFIYALIFVAVHGIMKEKVGGKIYICRGWQWYNSKLCSKVRVKNQNVLEKKTDIFLNSEKKEQGEPC